MAPPHGPTSLVLKRRFCHPVQCGRNQCLYWTLRCPMSVSSMLCSNYYMPGFARVIEGVFRDHLVLCDSLDFKPQPPDLHTRHDHRGLYPKPCSLYPFSNNLKSLSGTFSAMWLVGYDKMSFKVHTVPAVISVFSQVLPPNLDTSLGSRPQVALVMCQVLQQANTQV